jgi:multidrug resistance protein MdtO
MMSLAVKRIDERVARLRAWLGDELAPSPGRVDAVWRCLLSSALVMLCSLTLQVPSVSLSLIFVFFTAQENTVLTRLAGTVQIVGVTLAILVSLVLLKFTMDHPMLRILAACVIGFCGMYFMRVSRLGALGYMTALVVFVAQSVSDLVASPEAQVRALLWTWVAACYPIVVTVLINHLFLPAHPVRLLNDEMRRQLKNIIRQLHARRSCSAVPPLDMGAVERGMLVLHRHLTFAIQSDKRYAHDKARHLMRIAAMDRLHTAAAHLAQLAPRTPSPSQLEQLTQLQLACETLRGAVGGSSPFIAPSALPRHAPSEDRFATMLREMGHALQAIADADTAPPADLPRSEEGLLAADAFTNPVYAQFALKTVLATVLCYLFYTAVQWPGIRTAMVTCIIVALPSLGAISQKGLNRVLGCALGSAVSLLATVFIVPHLDSIAGLMALTLPVIAASAWIAAGSARTNYIGVQIAYAFALALLGSFGPSTDVTEIRDRLVGILVGLGVSITIHTLLWPEREGSVLKTMLARLMSAISGLVQAGREAMADTQKRQAIDQARVQGWSLLSQNRQLQARVALEPEWQYDHDSVTSEVTTLLAQAQQALFTVDGMQLLLVHEGAAMPHPAAQAFGAFQQMVIVRLDAIADQLAASATASGARPRARSADGLLAALSTLDRLLAGADPGHGFSRRLTELVDAAHMVVERVTQLEICASHIVTPSMRKT